MQIMLSLFLALAQLALLGAAVISGSPGEAADILGQGAVNQLLPWRPNTVQIQSDGSSDPSSAAAAAPSAPAASSPDASSGSTMRVQMDMYSGRPNPAWDISPQEADQVRTAFRQLSDRGPGTRPERLGYRGLIVNGDGVRDLGLTRVLVGGGVVIAEGFQGVRYLSDSDRSFERQLFMTGQSRLDPTDFAAFKSIAFP